jgi:anaerobic magnesium-protoporphyrin IX monomethyl ester cyclase
MFIVLCSLPNEPAYENIKPEVRAQGELPVTPKMAIVSLVKHMLKNGVTEDEYDFYDVDMLLPGDNELYDYFAKTKPDLVGLSAVTSCAYSQTKRIAKIIRRASPDSWIVLGGNLAASANVLLRKTEIDLCVVGDGEIAWSALIQHYRQYGNTFNDNLNKIAGISYLDESGNLLFSSFGEKLPLSEQEYIPDYDILKKGLQGRSELLSNYFRPATGSSWFNHDARVFDPGRKPNVAFIWSSKGCIVRCTFCQRPTKGYRAPEVEPFEASLRQLIEEYDVGYIMVADESFGQDRKQAYEFAALMKKLDLLWGAGGVRCDSVTRDVIKFYADNNCVGLKFGVESGSQKILDVMEKRFKVSDVQQAIKWCAEFKIFSPLAIMLGMPGETDETVRETAKYIAKLAYDIDKDPFAIFGGDPFYAIPFPGTPLYEYGQQLGIIGSSVDDEEAYLEWVFTAGYKMSYVNLNGAEVKDVLVWDLMLNILLRREYDKLVATSANAVDTSNVGGSDIQHGSFRQPSQVSSVFHQFAAAIVRKVKARDFEIRFAPYISNFLHRRVIVEKNDFKEVPESILLNVLKLALYFEYCLIKIYAKTCKKVYYKHASPILSRKRKVEDGYQQRFPDKKIVSLRNIVISDRKQSQDITEQNRIKLLNGM